MSTPLVNVATMLGLAHAGAACVGGANAKSERSVTEPNVGTYPL
jgi:hypothetical protein